MRSPSSSERARSATSGSRPPGPTPSAAHTRCTRSRRCNRSTHCGHGTSNPKSCHCCANWASAWCPSPPLGHGFLTGTIRTQEQFNDDTDFRKTNPRFTGENFQRNLQIADEVASVADEVGATPAQVALAWLLAQGDDLAPIPGTKRVTRVEENTAADAVKLSTAQIGMLNNLTPAAGEHHNEEQMQMYEV